MRTTASELLSEKSPPNKVEIPLMPVFDLNLNSA